MVISLKKLVGDFKNNFTQFTVLIILIVLSVFLFVGLFSLYWNTSKSYDNVVDESNIADYIVIKSDVEESDLSILDSNQFQTVLRMSYKQDDEIIDFNYILKNEISQFQVVDGEGFSLDHNKVWVDYNYCKNNNCEVGDMLTLTNEFGENEYLIAGLVYSPDYISYNLNENSLFPNYDKQGYVFLSRSNLSITNAYNFIYTRGITEDELKSQFSDDFVIESKDYQSYVTIESEINQALVMSIVFPSVFLLIVFITLYIVIFKYMDLERSSIKAFHSLGFAKKTIIRNYQVFITTLIFICVVIGAILGATILYPALIESQSNTIIFENRLGISKVLVIIISLIYFITLTTFTYFILKSKVIYSIYPKIDKLKRDTYRFSLGANASYIKWGIRQISLNIFRSVSTLLAITIAIAVFISALGLRDTVDKSESQTFDDGYLFEYMTTDQVLFENSIKSNITNYYESNSGFVNVDIKNDSILVELSTYNNNNMYKLIDKANEEVVFKSDDVYISSYIAKKYSVSVGEIITVDSKELQVTGVYESPNSETIFVDQNTFNKFMFEHNHSTFFWIDNVKIESDKIISKDDLRAEYQLQMDVLEEIIWIEIIVALIIFVVVLNNTFSLIKVNKYREISTLKVLGTQNFILTLLVSLEVVIIVTFAIVLSIPISKYILLMLIDPLKNSIYFYPSIKTQSYLLVFAISILILVLNIIVTGCSIKKIKMSESLKLIEHE